RRPPAPRPLSTANRDSLPRHMARICRRRQVRLHALAVLRGSAGVAGRCRALFGPRERSDAVALESRHLPRPRVLGRAPAAQRDKGQPRRLGEAVPAGAVGALARARRPAVPLLTSLPPAPADTAVRHGPPPLPSPGSRPCSPARAGGGGTPPLSFRPGSNPPSPTPRGSTW